MKGNIEGGNGSVLHHWQGGAPGSVAVLSSGEGGGVAQNAAVSTLHRCLFVRLAIVFTEAIKGQAGGMPTFRLRKVKPVAQQAEATGGAPPQQAASGPGVSAETDSSKLLGSPSP